MCLGALRGEHSLKVARSARAVQRFPVSSFADLGGHGSRAPKPHSLSAHTAVKPPEPVDSTEVQAKQKHKLVIPEVVEEVSQKISALVSEGVLMVYTDF